MSYYEEEALNTQAAKSKVPKYPSGSLFCHAFDLTDEQLLEHGYDFTATIDGKKYGILNQTVLKNFIANKKLHNKTITNIKLINPRIYVTI